MHAKSCMCNLSIIFSFTHANTGVNLMNPFPFKAFTVKRGSNECKKSKHSTKTASKRFDVKGIHSSGGKPQGLFIFTTVIERMSGAPRSKNDGFENLFSVTSERDIARYVPSVSLDWNIINFGIANLHEFSENSNIYYLHTIVLVW